MRHVLNRLNRLEIQSIMFGIFDPAGELLPPWTKEPYLCTDAPLTSLWHPPLATYQSKCILYTDRVWRWGKGGVELCCRPYSAGV
jgi:hypothetical protein